MGFGERRVSTVHGYFPGVASGYLEGEVDGREIVKSSRREARKREGRERNKEVLKMRNHLAVIAAPADVEDGEVSRCQLYLVRGDDWQRG